MYVQWYRRRLVEYKDIDEIIERDIFQRVQMGVPLAAAGMYRCPFTDYSKSEYHLQRNSLPSRLPTPIGSHPSTRISSGIALQSTSNGIAGGARPSETSHS